IFKQPVNTTLFLQNAFLLPTQSLKEIGNLKSYLRIMVERFVFKNFIKNIDVIEVQTKWMKDELKKWDHKLEVKVIPTPPKINYTPKSSTEKFYDIISVTSLQPHKRLNDLLEALKKARRDDLNVLIVLDSNSYKHR